MSDDVVSRAAGAPATGSLREAMDGRANIFAMTEAVHDAALMPADPGGLSHALRAAIAARLSRCYQDEALAAHYRALLDKAGSTPELAAIAEGSAAWQADVAALTAYADKAGATPRDMTATDILALQTAGVADADIVRLAELIAFLAYQLRVVAALRLVGEAP